MMGEPLLAVQSVTKSFGGIKALNGVSFEVAPGEVVGLIGPNGAGKTTLFNVISGLIPPTSGDVRLAGQSITAKRPDEICSMGAVRTFQSASLLIGMTVWDNVHVASLFRPPDRRNGETAADCTRRVLELCGLLDKEDVVAETLTTGEQKRVEIARAMASNPKLLMTDEILAGLNPTDSEQVLSLLLQLRDVGVSIIFVEHDVRSVMKISDRVVVVAQGKKLVEGLPQEVATSPDVIEVYLGGRYAKDR